VNRGFLRLDQGVEDEGFILFDSADKTIYSVDPEERTVLVIKHRRPGPEPRSVPTSESSRVDGEKVPKVAGVKPEHWEFHSDGRLCRSAMVLPGVMDSALAVYANYLEQHGLQQQVALNHLPEEFRDACELANQVYHPAAALSQGLPLRIWEPDGESWELIDFRQHFSVGADLFTLPQGFREIFLGER
jgi:hypothetical protein